jgi:hypothetical protein
MPWEREVDELLLAYRGRRAMAGRGGEGEHAIGEEQQGEGWALSLLPSLKGGAPMGASPTAQGKPGRR